MALTCKICGHPTPSVKDLYCRKHQRSTLRQLEAEGYLEPLTVTTVDGVQQLSKHRFLTLPDAPSMTGN